MTCKARQLNMKKFSSFDKDSKEVESLLNYVNCIIVVRNLITHYRGHIPAVFQVVRKRLPPATLSIDIEVVHTLRQNIVCASLNWREQLLWLKFGGIFASTCSDTQILRSVYKAFISQYCEANGPQQKNG